MADRICHVCGQEYSSRLTWGNDPKTKEPWCKHDSNKGRSYWSTEAGKDVQRAYEQLAKMERELN